MSEKEITRAQFTEVTGLPDPSEIVYPLNPGPNTPVQMVSWYHALIFCNMMSIAEDRTPVYTISGSTDPADWGTAPVDPDYAGLPAGYWSIYHENLNWDTAAANWSADGYRLPTESEWMWAAMGAAGGTTGYLKTFAGSTGSNAIEDYAWTIENSLQTTQPVGRKLPNELGLYDMSGNVFEWCWDWYDAYPAGPLSDYTGPASAPAGTTHRVSRGGSWQCVKSYAAVADRSCSTKTCHGHHNIGFRISRRP
jgi:formylglycine-generating enzyme required for sulfatase activity